MADVPQTDERRRLVEQGDRFMETTPSGRKIPLTVLEVDVEPNYPLDPDRPYVRLSREHTNFVMSERVLLDVDWIQPVPKESENTDG